MRVLVFILLLAAVAPAHAQPSGRPVRPPRALLERLMADIDESDVLGMEGIDSLAKWITVTRRDFNGDGVREWEVEGTGPCVHNCERWIYRRLPGGRFVEVYNSSGMGIEVLRTRSHGWPDLRQFWHMSCCSGSTSTSVFDGRRYQWRETRYEVWHDGEQRPHTTFHLSITPPEAPGPQRLVLDHYDAGGGLSVSARYDICRPGRVRTDVCGAPRLILSSARLPAGRMCVRMRARTLDHPEYRSRPGGGWCGATAPDPAARGRRRLVLHPTREDWIHLALFLDVDLIGPGLPGKLQTLDAYGLLAFASALEDHYRLPCAEGYSCRR